MLRLYVQAPFAAFRTFTAGWYRPTATFLTPSAAYGLALNLAGIETRRDDDLSAMTVTRFGLPPARIALGAVPDGSRGRYPTVQTIYQQLHNYPVGASGKQRKEDAKGSKYNITPVRREFLADLRAIVALDFHQHSEVEDLIRQALDVKAPKSATRYGLPFLGDNAFLIDKIKVCNKPVTAHWYGRLGEGYDSGPVPHSTRLTIWIDRQDMSGTRTALFAPIDPASEEPPEPAWTPIDPPPEPTPAAKRPGKKG
ncbi:MAG TPA: type I-MYXAN CRISPR-associated protein Cas5/Cmx5/DevS [Isosphaeraceae bacterium]|jgi:CRISPR-associated protein Cas5t